MADRHAEIRDQIQNALDELDSERKRLEKALNYLDMGITPSLGSPLRPVKPKRRSSGKRAPHGQREKQFLDAVKGKSGITVAEIAKQIGVSPPNALYALGKKLAKEGKVAKSGAGYSLKTGSSKSTGKQTKSKAKKAS